MRTTAELLKAARTIRRGATGFAARARAERRGVLSLNQTAVLGLLVKQETITPGEIAHRLRMQPQALTRTFAALEEQGWARRLPDPSDGRQSLLTITAIGREVLADEMRPRDAWVAHALERELTDAEIELLVVAARLLERLAEVDAAVAPTEVAPARAVSEPTPGEVRMRVRP
jgi:DNA-binding MarR family transcriptional regulator